MCNSAIKINAPLYTITWVNFHKIMLNKRSLNKNKNQTTQQQKHHYFPFMPLM